MATWSFWHCLGPEEWFIFQIWVNLHRFTYKSILEIDLEFKACLQARWGSFGEPYWCSLWAASGPWATVWTPLLPKGATTVLPSSVAYLGKSISRHLPQAPNGKGCECTHILHLWSQSGTVAWSAPECFWNFLTGEGARKQEAGSPHTYLITLCMYVCMLVCMSWRKKG